MNIPKIIHYCWFGPKEIPAKEKRCIDSWKKLFPEYEFKFWNEQTFDLDDCIFARQAYDKGMYAFVSDYVRTFVLYKYGGIYLDTDVEVLCDFQEMLDSYAMVLGFETRKQIGTAVIASVPRHPVLEDLMSLYETIKFETKYGDNITANVRFFTDLLCKKGLQLGGHRQVISNILVCEREIFYPKKISSEEFAFSERTVAVHLCSNSWMTPRAKRRGNSIMWTKCCRPLLLKGKALLNLVFRKSAVMNLEVLIRNWLK